MAVFFRLYTTHTSNLRAGDGGDTREGMPDSLSAGSPTLSFARPPRLATDGGSITQGLTMSTCNSSACGGSAEPTQNQFPDNVLRSSFDRIHPRTAEFFSGRTAVNQINRHFLAFQGLNAISRLLLGNMVAEDSFEATIDANTVGGLVSAAIALTEMAIDNIEYLADRADKQTSEVGHE